jgi:signal transduction histidine kinase
MTRTPWPYRGPLIAGLALFAASCAWAWLYWGTLRERELDQIGRLSDALVSSLEALLDPANGARPEDDAALERLLLQRLRLKRPVLYVLVLRNDRTVATVGDVPPELADPREAGRFPGRGLVVFRRALGEPAPGAPPDDRPPRPNDRRPRRDDRPAPPEGRRLPPPDDDRRVPGGNPWAWRSGSGAERVEVVVGCDTTLPRRVFEKNVPELLFALAVGWAGIVALVLAWYRSIRTRELARALDAERRERARLEELNLAAAGLAHETKNPLGIILGLAQRIARDSTAPTETREVAEQIVDAADQAAARISDFLGFARLGTPTLEPARLDALLHHVVGALQADFDDAGVGVEVLAPAVHAVCAPSLVEQVLVNLLLNALQASEAGTRVTLRLVVQGATATLVVEDQGRGIPPGLVPEVFKPYVSGRADGHGLGLAIVKRIVDQHGWSIALHSVVAGGTRVTISDIAVTTAEEAGA